MSLLTYAGSKKITRLPRRSAIVAFSADEVYAIAELIRRQRGGAAVVLGSLSPRTRNAQVELFQSGDVDFLVATDAIGMGLNLDVDHVAFAVRPKIRRLPVSPVDGCRVRPDRRPRRTACSRWNLRRHQSHRTRSRMRSSRRSRRTAFDAVKTVQWRNRDLDFTSLATALKDEPRAGYPTATD